MDDIPNGTIFAKARKSPVRPPYRFDWWTHERIDLLRQRWDEGRTASTIADELGTTRNAILGKVHRLSLAPRLNSHRDPSDPSPPRQRRPRAPRLARIPGEFFEVALPMKIVPSPPNMNPIEMMALEESHCRYIVGSSDNGMALYCAEPKRQAYMPNGKLINWGPYCPYHAHICYDQSPYRNRR